MTRLGVQKGDKVCIVPIREYGTVAKIRQDRLGDPIIDVTLEGGKNHICREFELYAVDENKTTT